MASVTSSDPAALAMQQRQLANVLFGDFAADPVRLEELSHRFIKAYHAVVPVGDQVVVDALNLAGTDGTGNRIGVPQHFKRQVSLIALFEVGEQSLADYRAQA